jgi:hypothetical protein
MAQKNPLGLVKDKFGDKSKLVEAVKAFVTEDLWLGRTASDRGKDKGLRHVSNAKLLRLHATFSEVKEKFGTRAKLIDAILESEKRTKDAGYKKRIEAYPVPRLYDAYKSSMKRHGGKLEAAPAKSAKPAKSEAAAEQKPAAKPKAKAAPKAKAPKA